MTCFWQLPVRGIHSNDSENSPGEIIFDFAEGKWLFTFFPSEFEFSPMNGVVDVSELMSKFIGQPKPIPFLLPPRME